MYTDMIQENIGMSAQSLKDRVVRNEKTIQTGYYDKYILCQQCENEMLGGLDRYGANVIYHGVGVQMDHGKEVDGIRPLFVKGIDYDKFKIFLLSILWRAHISNNPFFENIRLGKDAEPIRQAILNNLHVDESVYKVQMFALKYSSTELFKMVITPIRMTALGADYYTFIINGLVYFINMQLADEPSFFAKGFLRNNGSVVITELNPDLALGFLRSYFKVGPNGLRV